MERIRQLTGIDPWFLENIRQIVNEEDAIAKGGAFNLRRAKQLGFSDRQLAHLTNSSETDVRARRLNGLFELLLLRSRQQLGG